ncbi:MAG: VCBS domain-containing protein [Alsobacter sp.]
MSSSSLNEEPRALRVGTAADDTLVGGLTRDVIDTGGGASVVWADLALDPSVWALAEAAKKDAAARLAYDRAAAAALDAAIASAVAPAGGPLSAAQAAALSDVVNGGSGADIIFAGLGNDTLNGGAGDDRIFAGGGADVASGGSGDDLVDGGAGDDTLQGEAGADTLLGGTGGDLLFGGAGADVLDGEDGNDVLWGGDEADGARGDVLRGGRGQDVLFGEGGQDTLDGGEGRDMLFGGAGDDSVDGGEDADTLFGSSGNDALVGNGDDALFGNEGDDRLSAAGATAANSLFGGAGDDTLQGGACDDSIDGGEGTDLAVFTGTRADYDVTYDAATDTFTVRDLRGGSPDGFDTVRNVENFQFADGTRTAEEVKATGSAGAAIEDGAAVTQYALPEGSALQVAVSGDWSGFALFADDVYLGPFGYQNASVQGVSFDRQRGFTLDPSVDYYQDLAQGQTRTMRVDYQLYDPTTGTYTPASITWTVTGTNDAPAVSGPTDVAVSDDATATQLRGVVAMPFSDVDQGDTLGITATGLSGVGTNGKPVGRIVYDGQAGQWVYEADRAAFSSLDRGQAATETFTVTATDSHGAKTSTTLTVTITGEDDAPIVTGTGVDAEGNVQVAESTRAVTRLSATDIDSRTVDGRAPQFRYEIVGGADADLFIIDERTGELAFKAAPDFEGLGSAAYDNVYDVQVRATPGRWNAELTSYWGIYDPQYNRTLSDWPYYSATNGYFVSAYHAGQEDLATVRTLAVTVTDIADGPRIAAEERLGDSASLSVQDDVAGAASGAATLTVANDGRRGFSWTSPPGYPRNQYVYDWRHTYAVTLRAGGSASGAAPGTLSLADGYVWAPNGNALDGVSHLTWTYAVDHAAIAFLAEGETATERFTITVTDAVTGRTTSQDVSVTITGADDATTITSAADADVAENTREVTTIVAADPDRRGHFVYEIVCGDDAALFTIDAATGVLSFVAPQDYEATPTDANGDRIYDVVVKAHDSARDALAQQNGATQRLAIRLTDVAEIVTLKADSFAGQEDGRITGNVLANDTIPDGATIKARLVSDVSHGALTFNADGSFVYTPAANWSGADSFTYAAGDGTGSVTVTLSVAGVADKPTLSVLDASPRAGQATALTLTAALTDNDGSETLSVRIAGLPADATLNTGTRQQDGSWLLTAAQLSGLTLTLASDLATPLTLTVTATATEQAGGSTASTSATMTLAPYVAPITTTIADTKTGATGLAGANGLGLGVAGGDGKAGGTGLSGITTSLSGGAGDDRLTLTGSATGGKGGAGGTGAVGGVLIGGWSQHDVSYSELDGDGSWIVDETGSHYGPDGAPYVVPVVTFQPDGPDGPGWNPQIVDGGAGGAAGQGGDAVQTIGGWSLSNGIWTSGAKVMLDGGDGADTLTVTSVATGGAPGAAGVGGSGGTYQPNWNGGTYYPYFGVYCVWDPNYIDPNTGRAGAYLHYDDGGWNGTPWNPGAAGADANTGAATSLVAATLRGGAGTDTLRVTGQATGSTANVIADLALDGGTGADRIDVTLEATGSGYNASPYTVSIAASVTSKGTIAGGAGNDLVTRTATARGNAGIASLAPNGVVGLGGVASVTDWTVVTGDDGDDRLTTDFRAVGGAGAQGGVGYGYAAAGGRGGDATTSLASGAAGSGGAGADVITTTLDAIGGMGGAGVEAELNGVYSPTAGGAGGDASAGSDRAAHSGDGGDDTITLVFSAIAGAGGAGAGPLSGAYWATGAAGGAGGVATASSSRDTVTGGDGKDRIALTFTAIGGAGGVGGPSDGAAYDQVQIGTDPYGNPVYDSVSRGGQGGGGGGASAYLTSDSVSGGDGDDVIDIALRAIGGDGGGPGYDSYYQVSGAGGAGGAATAQVAYSTIAGGAGADVIHITLAATAGADATNAPQIGNHGQAVLYGSSVSGGDGDDSIDVTLSAEQGGVAYSTIDGGLGQDRFAFHAGRDWQTSFDLGQSRWYTFDSTGGSWGANTIRDIETLVLGDSRDTVLGSAARETVDGGAGDDSLSGGGGGDSLVGGAGLDTLDGGAGDDTLSGGTGADDFIYRAKGFGQDQIADFHATGGAGDRLVFSISVFADFADVRMHTIQQGSDLLISLSATDTILLKNVALSAFDASDVRFF